MRIITGMHRSGTSLVARLLFEAGADLGDSDTFYRPDRWNPDGYFEQPDIHAINMPLIHGPWGRLSYFSLPSTRTILKRGSKRGAQIRAAAAKYRRKAVKDCRFCLTLPAWTKHDAPIDRMLVCLRDPIAVVHSVRKRNRITLRYAYRLWLLHYERLLENARRIPLWFIYYGNLLDEQRFAREMKPALEFFEIELSDNEMTSLRQRCVKPQLNHGRKAAQTYPEEVEDRWQELLDRHSRQFQTVNIGEIPP